MAMVNWSMVNWSMVNWSMVNGELGMVDLPNSHFADLVSNDYC